MLIIIGKFYDAEYTVVLNKTTAVVLNLDGDTILTSWRDETSPWLWSFHLQPNPSANTLQQVSCASAANQQKLFVNNDISVALSVYDTPSVKDIVRYIHAADGFPIK